MSLLTEAIVLKRLPAGENDLSYVLLTSEIGKVRVLARGGRKIKSKLAPHLAGIAIVDVLLIEGRNGYGLAGAKIKQDFRHLCEVDCLLASANLFLSLIDSVLPEKAKEDEIFQLTADTLKELVNVSNDIGAKIKINSAIYKLLKILGLQPDISSATNQRELFVSLIGTLESVTDRLAISQAVY